MAVGIVFQEWFHSIDQTDCGYIRQQDLVVAALSRSMSMMDREVWNALHPCLRVAVLSVVCAC